MCGGTQWGTGINHAKEGLSPRVRGNRFARKMEASMERSIPACAGEPNGYWWLRYYHKVYPRVCGEPRARFPPIGLTGVYPRVCGGTRRLDWIATRSRGLSPRVRGNQRAQMWLSPYFGSIPACAGEPSSERAQRLAMEVYPRVCGGTAPKSGPDSQNSGLSPRVRGNHDWVSAGAWQIRSIPACAGEPSRECAAVILWRVYPRVCGGTSHKVPPSP